MDKRQCDVSPGTGPDIVTFGESMALLMPETGKGIEYSPQLNTTFGGAESNVAIGLARLGHHAGWFGQLGHDPFGRMVLKKIRGEGVDVSRAKLLESAPTGLMLREAVAGKTSVYYYRRFSAMSKMRPEDLDEAYIAQAQILHITGITPALSESCLATVKAAVRIAKRHGVKVCFDPNLRLKLWGIERAREALLSLAGDADYFLPGLDELKLLYQTEDFDEIISKLGRLSAVSVVKGGDEESYLVEKGRVTAVPFVKAERVVDTVGAGDGFCAGFLSAIVQGSGHLEAVKLGSLLGSLVVQAPGDWEGLPTREEIDAVLQGSGHIER
ncbi:sugar kinase [Paenibacillus lutrae]|uniref:Sugar kinase n=1 Tax=Paenibacillus lutrae TaxID=2078573 RepID=A0A7X3FFC2_9BACL|nr:sugar kinase [Paenibacillus lutrae]MVO98663.1 sugar kinase [Paenibacillus lutrae]